MPAPTNKQWRDTLRREVQSRSASITGVVITKRTLKFFNGASAETWVADVTTGSNRDLRNVPIKAGPGGGIEYANLGMTVRLDRNGQKFQVVGPSDRVIGINEIKTYTFGNPTPVTETNEGQSFRVEAYSFFQGPTPGTPGTSLWNDGVTSYPAITKIDGDGNPI